ncbi:MAG: alpha/beta hydrolase [Pirellulales bacterium]|nr:alpha/beta hydrolase [Pirellulales bacterium]
METQHHTLRDGRTLAYCQFGDPEGDAIFYAHGGPGSRLEGRLFHDEAQQRHYRVIAPDRPGMGESTYLPGRNLLDYPRDLIDLADALGIERFGVMGWSAGGAHTTVCGYAIPDRLLFNMTFAGYTNFAQLPGAETYLESKLDQISVGLSRKHPRLFKLFFDLMNFSEKLMPRATYKAFVKTLSEPDRRIAAQPEFAELFIASQAQAFKQGSRGATTDAAVHYVDWGFRLEEISARLHVFHGTEDRLVPLEYGRHLAQHVPDCELHVIEGEGHLLPYKYLSLIFDTADAERSRAECACPV